MRLVSSAKELSAELGDLLGSKICLFPGLHCLDEDNVFEASPSCCFKKDLAGAKTMENGL
jgi:hypothetical protein